MKREKQQSFLFRRDRRAAFLNRTAGRRGKRKNRISLAGSIVILFQLCSLSLWAESVVQFEETFHWASPNMILHQNMELSDMQKSDGSSGDKAPLSNYAYNYYFDSFGAPPPLDFLAKLEGIDPDSVEIDKHHIKFKKYGKTVPLNRSLVPDWADPAKPYAISTPLLDMVAIVYPYYFYQCKQNKYFSEIYNLKGELLQIFDSLPTHVAVNNPNLLISPERSGCCESIRWEFRFYNIAERKMTQLSCPEGFCGDVLFKFIDQYEHYLLVQEIVDSISGVGTYLQTNIYLIDNQGNLNASGQTVFATKDNQSSKENISTIAPFGLRNLLSVDRIKNGTAWLLHYRNGSKQSTAQITGQTDSASPTALFLLADERVARLKNTEVKIAGYKVRQSPSLLIAAPGKYMITTRSAKGVEISTEVEVKPNTINKLPVEF